MFKGNIPTPVTSYITVREVYSMAAEIARKSWQRSLDNESTGRFTYELVPAVYTKILFPSDRDIGISYCRMLLHDTMLQQDSFRTGTSFTPICECGTEEESVQHLLRCQNYTAIRSELFNNIEDCLGEKSISEVMGCFFSHHLFKITLQSRTFFIKEALFEYIAKSKRQM